MIASILLAAALATALSPAQAAPRKAAKAPTAAAQPKPAETQVIWDAWYTVTLSGSVHYAYYNDRIEKRQGRLFFQNRFWKQEEGFINEEQVGAYAEDNADLTPLFFNFHSTYRTTETQIDGTIENGARLTVKARRGGSDLPLVKRSIPKKLFLSVFFPVWLGRELSGLQPGKTRAFMTLMEDSLDAGFPTSHGSVRLEKPDEMAKKLGGKKLLVNYRDARSVWYVDDNGVPLRVEMPGRQNTVIEKVTAENAQSFLASAPPSAEEPDSE